MGTAYPSWPTENSTPNTQIKTALEIASSNNPVPGGTDVAWKTLNNINNTLITDDTVRYVVVPAMVGGLGSVALQMVQDGGSFVDRSEEQTAETAAQNNNDESAIQANQTAQNETIKTLSQQPHKHDFVPAIQMHGGVEFSILTVSSILLGAVVGYIGAILTLDGPPQRSNNKPKLAATALMFALFFPSVIQVLEKNVKSEANKIKTELQEDVQAAEQAAEINAQLTKEKEQAAKENIDQANQNLNQVTESFEQLDAANHPQLLQIQATTESLVESKWALIDEAKSFALEATSDESAKQFINSIFDIGSSDDDDVKQYAIKALEEIKETSEVPAVEAAAKGKAQALDNAPSNNDN